MADSKEKETYNISTFVSETTLHGLPKACSSKSYLRRAFWILLVLCMFTALGVCLYLIVESYVR